ncbi:hypothetical protein [Arcanobacterium canis]
MTNSQPYSLAAYAPNGERKGYLATPETWSASMPINDIGSMNLSYGLDQPHAEWLTEACEIAIEVANPHTGKWEETPSGRFILVEEKADAAKGAADVPSYTLVGYGSLLGKITGVPAAFSKAKDNYTPDGKRHFLNANPGQIMTAFLQEARALVDGLQPGIELGFTTSTDSAGRPWAHEIDLDYEPTVSMLTALQNLAKQGMCDFWLEGRTLKMVNPDSTARNTGIELHNDFSEEAPVQSTRAGLLHTVFLVGEEGKTWREDNPSAQAPWGTTMSVLTQGGVSREATARRLAKAELERGSQARTERTWQAVVNTLDWVAPVDVAAGDWVRVKTSDGFEEMRVFQLTLNAQSEKTTVALTINDRFEDAQVRAAKRLAGITGGASGDAGTSTIPAKDSAKAVPKAPQGLTTESEGYWIGAEPRSRVRVGFAPVTDDVNNVPITIDHYEVNVGGKTTDTTDTTDIVVEDLAPGYEVAVSVVAVSSEGVRSAPTTKNITTVLPDERLFPPTKFRAVSNFGIISLEWDGLLQAPGRAAVKPPKHFDHLNVYASIGEGAAKIGTLHGGVFTYDAQARLGQTLEFWATAVDRLGSESEPGPRVKIEVSSVVSDELSKAKRETAQAVAQWQTVMSKLKDHLRTFSLPADRVEGLEQVVQRSAAGKAKITYSTSVPSGSGKTAGDVWYQRDAKARSITGFWIWDGGRWAPQKLDHKVLGSVDVGSLTAGGASIDTAVARKLFSDVVVSNISRSGQFIGGSAIIDGTIDAKKFRVDEGFVNRLFANQAFIGLVKAQIVSTKQTIKGPGVEISGDGVAIDGRFGGIRINPRDGLTFSSTDELFHLGMDGAVTMVGDLKAGSTVTGAVIKTDDGPNRTQLDTKNGLTVYRNGDPLVQVGAQYDTGLAIWDEQDRLMRPLSALAFRHLSFERGMKDLASSRFFTSSTTGSLQSVDVVKEWSFRSLQGNVTGESEIGTAGYLKLGSGTSGVTIMIDAYGAFTNEESRNQVFDPMILVTVYVEKDGRRVGKVECLLTAGGLYQGKSSLTSASASGFVGTPHFTTRPETYSFKVTARCANGRWGNGAGAGTATLARVSAVILPR